MAPKAKPKKSTTEWASYYGWALALLKSDSSLYDLFQKAIAGNWSKAKFQAALRDTSWYKTHGETARKTLALKYTDPETWRERVRAIYTNIQQMAGQMGIREGWQTYWDMAEDALMFGWDNAKLRSVLADYVKGGQDGYYGEAGQAEDQLREYAYSMGVRLDEGALNGWMKGILNGTRTVDDFKNELQKLAISAFPTLADDIRGGLSVRDIASSYMQTMARILEINPGDLDVFDPTIRGALTSVDPSTGKPSTKPLWQFEEELRKDPRWLQTNNARESINTTARDVLRNFGFVW